MQADSADTARLMFLSVNVSINKSDNAHTILNNNCTKINKIVVHEMFFKSR